MQAAITDTDITSLIPGCQRGEAAAVEALYDLYSDRLYRYFLARTSDPDASADLTTEVFLRMITHIGGFRLRPEYPAAAFSAWMYRIAGNLLTDHRRAQRRGLEVEWDDCMPVPGLERDPHTTAEKGEASARLAEALEQLTEEQRLVLIGKFGEDMSNPEIASWLGRTEGAVKSLQHRALRTLARLLGAEGV